MSAVNFNAETQRHRGWKLRRLKSILRPHKTIVGKRCNEYNLLSLSLRGVIKRDMDNPEGKFPASFETYQEVSPGDFVFCMFDNEETPRAVGLSSLRGMITGAYDVMSLIGDGVNKDFLNYYFLWVDEGKRLKPLYKGLRKTVPLDSFLAFKIPLPPLPEQEAIVKYLDEATGKIDKAIAAEEKMVALLQERREIVINEAVLSRGWRGAKRLKTILSETRDLSTTGKELPLSLTATDGIIPFSKKKNRTLENDTYVGTKIVRKGQIVFNRFRARLFAVSGYDGLVSPDYAVFSVGAEADARYLVYMFNTMAFKAQLNLLASGIGDGFSRVYAKDLLSVSIQLPPLPEQEAIVKRLDEETGKIDRAIAVKRRQIELLRERREIIINEVVTGKVKVA